MQPRGNSTVVGALGGTNLNCRLTTPVCRSAKLSLGSCLLSQVSTCLVSQVRLKTPTYLRHSGGGYYTEILRQDLHPTTRLASYDKTCILRQDLHPKTRLASYDKTCILQQDLHPTTRIASHDKTCILLDNVGISSTM